MAYTNDTQKANFKSPLPKLVNFFKTSRDNWKDKYMKAKYRSKLLYDQVMYWKKKAAELKLRVKELEKALGEFEKLNSSRNSGLSEKFSEVPSFHKYSYEHIYLFLQLVLHTNISMRASSRVLELFFKFLDLEIDVPSWTAGRMWLLRIGLYKLERPKTIADDWIWIIDHTIQLGKEKCLVILGIRQELLPEGELYLTHKDVEPIALIPVEQSNGDIVFQQLEETIKKTGVPKQIVSDNGPDIKSGSDKFCEKYGVIQTYDIKHKGAALLKRELNGDDEWEKFSKQSSKTSKMVQQTELSGMTPPNQRSKARYMNLGELVNWGDDIIVRMGVEKRNLGEEFENCPINEKFGWVDGYWEQLQDWKSLVEITETANQFVNFMGLYKGIDADLRNELDESPQNPRFAHIKEELIRFTGEQQKKIGDEDRLLGSSEIIESVIGKCKGLQHDQVKGGFTGLLLGLAASVSDLSMETVKEAIDSIPTKKVWQWKKENIGKSVYSKRKEFHTIVKLEEQKWEENLCMVSP